MQFIFSKHDFVITFIVWSRIFLSAVNSVSANEKFVVIVFAKKKTMTIITIKLSTLMKHLLNAKLY